MLYTVYIAYGRLVFSQECIDYYVEISFYFMAV